jgi:ABC-type sugar transport system substrate-binding protein
VNKLKVVLSLITRDNDYQREQAKSAELVAHQLNVDLEVVYANNDSVTQSSQLLDLMHKYKSELKGILVEPAGGTAFPQVGAAALRAGVAWVVLNRDAGSIAELRQSPSIPVFVVGTDHKQVGRIQAQQLAAILPQGGTVLYVQGPASSLAAQHRLIGIEAAKSFNITLKTLKSANWTEEAGYHAVSSWLRLSTSKQQPICAVAAQNDFIALGARKAFEEAKPTLPNGPWSQLPFLGVDGLPRTGQAFVNCSSLLATVIVPPGAGVALEALVKALANGTEVPALRLIASQSYPPIETLKPIFVPAQQKAAPAIRS